MSEATRMRDAAAALTPIGLQSIPSGQPARPDPSILLLLTPKWLMARGRATLGTRGHGVRMFILLGVALLFWSVVLALLVKLLRYFAGIPEIGALLAGKLLGMIMLGFLSILLLSNIIAALSTFFLAKDLDLLVSAPVDWLKMYVAKQLETMTHSSWMVALLSLPIFVAYGWVYEGGLLFIPLALAVFLPLLLIPSVIGATITMILVNVFPARRTRDILSFIAVLSAAGLVLLFRLMRPEQLARPEGFRSLVDFVAVLRTPSSSFLPSEWVQQAMMSFLNGSLDALPLYLLWTTAAALVVVGALVHRRLYDSGFSRAQEGANRGFKARVTSSLARALLAPFGATRRELILKEVRVFMRDTTQWSQLILLGVLIVVYVFNIKFLPLRGEGITFFLVNVIPFLNLVLAGFVLASIAARFIFPAVSLEGRTLWLLKSSPMPIRSLLWAKFWVGTLPLLILALAIVGLTNVLLQVSEFMMVISIFTVTLMTFALAAMALGVGALFPQFDTENAAQIPTSFGGLIYMMLAVVLIGGVILLQARPVYIYLSAEAFGTASDPTEMAIGFGLSALLCLTATFLPLTAAMRKLSATEL
jgi:ABC-2 type transport system permease protein